MCGRYNIIDNAAIQALLDSLDVSGNLGARVNVAPTEKVPAIISTGDVNELHDMRWWLTPSWAPEVSTKYSMFNARIESVASSKAFRSPFQKQRAVLPASSFIEWCKTKSGSKQPYLVKAEEGCLALAGVWDLWQKSGDQLESCAILTTNAVPGMQWLHHRMPLMVEKSDLEVWLDPSTPSEVIEEISLKPLSQSLLAYPITAEVGNSSHKSLSLLESVGDPVEIKH